MFGLLERGVERRPDVAHSMRGRIVLRFDEDFTPVRITFGARTVTVEDGDLRKPDLVIAGSLPDIVHFATAPHVRGVPNPARVRGRAALAQVASRRVRVSGDTALGRKLLQLLAL
jgi:ubiquinone biosynthesis protein UbiJ